MTVSIKLNQIGQIALKVKDLERAVVFYRDVLGMQFLFQAPPGLAFFQCGDVRLMLEPNEDAGASILYYKVEDIDAAHRQFQAKQVEFVDTPHKIADMPDHELWMVFFHDSEGNLLGLMAEQPLKP